jgi:hypothetical protein
MRISTLVSVAAMTLAATVGSAFAADQFATLKGIKAVPMSSAELSAIKGMAHHFFVITPHETPNTIALNIGGGVIAPVLDPAVAAPDGHPLETDGRFGTNHHQDDSGRKNFVDLGFVNMMGNVVLVSPAYHGLQHACDNAVIAMPTFVAC